jgi:hypothetical protein
LPCDEDLSITDVVGTRPAIVVLALLLLAATTGCTATSDPAAKPAHPSSPAGRGCHARVDRGPLPTWARGGFTPADQAIPHVVSAKGDIAGVLFGDPLSAPRESSRSNKILWVSRPEVVPGSSLRIHATLDGTSTVADRQVEGGPGPSNIDLPKPGCWTLDLRWSGHVDSVQLEYVDG